MGERKHTPDQVALNERVARAMWAAESNERTAAVFPEGRSARVLWSEAEITAENYGLTVTEPDRQLWRARAAAALEAAAAPEMLEALEPFAAWTRAFNAEVSTLHAHDDPLYKVLLQGPDLAPLTIGDMRRALAALSIARAHAEDRSFPEAGDGRPALPMQAELWAAGCDHETARFVARQLRRDGYYLVRPDDLGWDDIRRFQAEIRKGQDVFEDGGGFFVRAISALLRIHKPGPVRTYQDAAREMLEARARDEGDGT